jgi:hypothetical protein
MQRKFFLTLIIILSAMMFSITAAAQQKFSVYLKRQTRSSGEQFARQRHLYGYA